MTTDAPPPGFNPQVQHVPPHLQQQPGAPIIIAAPVFGPKSSSVHCQTCNQTVNTKVVMKASGKTHLVALACCLFGCCLCAPCTYCIDSLQVMNHYCPNCNSYLGEYTSL